MLATVLSGLVIALLVACEPVVFEDPEPPPESGQVPPDEPGEPEPPDPPEQQPDSAAGARVSISSTPSGAQVTINDDSGNRFATAAAPLTTPATIDLPRGEYAFTITKPGAGTVEGSVSIESKEVDISLNVRLDNNTGTDRLPEFDDPRINYWHTHRFGPRHRINLIEENPYYPARDDATDKRIIQGVPATAGNPPYSYALTGVPDGMVFDPDTRILHGTPAAGTALIWEGVYSITDADGDTIGTDVLFVVFPDAEPYFDSTVDDQTYHIGTEIAPLQLPEVKWTDITIPRNTTDHSITFEGKSEGTLPTIPGLWGDKGEYSGWWNLSDWPRDLWIDYLYVHNLQPVPSGEVTEPTAFFISGTPKEAGTFPVTRTVVDSSEDTATVGFTITVVGPDPEPPSRPVVSFATSETHVTHVWGSEGSVSLPVHLSSPAPQPLSIGFDGFHSGSVTVPEGASRATIAVPLKSDPLVQDGGTLSTNIILLPGDGYEIERPAWFDLRIKYLVDDHRCPYPMPHTLLERASSAGVLCVTGTTEVSQSELDRVSGVPTIMLQNRTDIANQLTSTNHIILLYGQVHWCDAWPSAYYSMGCTRPKTASGIYSAPIIVCPKKEMSICGHEIAHAVHTAAGDSEDAAIERRFNNPEVQENWRGYALNNHREFFAEMSTIYFCIGTNATLPRTRHLEIYGHLHCADALQAYDPATYEVIHAIYRGSADLR